MSKYKSSREAWAAEIALAALTSLPRTVASSTRSVKVRELTTTLGEREALNVHQRVWLYERALTLAAGERPALTLVRSGTRPEQQVAPAVQEAPENTSSKKSFLTLL